MLNLDIYDQLERIASKSDFAELVSELVETWSSSELGVQVIEPILKFMEVHSEVDFGSPGELVHFLEGFYRRGYEAKLIESVQRKPTEHTVWMLNRVINGTKDWDERERCISVLKNARSNTASDDGVLQVINQFLQRLSI